MLVGVGDSGRRQVAPVDTVVRGLDGEEVALTGASELTGFTAREHFKYTLLENGVLVQERGLHDPFITATIVLERPTFLGWLMGLFGRRHNVILMVRGDDAAQDLILGAADPAGWKPKEEPADVQLQVRKFREGLQRNAKPAVERPDPGPDAATALCPKCQRPLHVASPECPPGPKW